MPSIYVAGLVDPEILLSLYTASSLFRFIAVQEQ